jgi:hypothetical protein
MLYQCSKCLKYFDKKSNYNQHLLRKMSCKESNDKKIDHDVKEKLEELECFQMIPNGVQMETKGNQNDSIIQCLICNKIYHNRSGLFKHKKLKHPNYDIDIKQSNKIDALEKSEIEKLKELFITQIHKLV